MIFATPLHNTAPFWVVFRDELKLILNIGYFRTFRKHGYIFQHKCGGRRLAVQP